MRERGRGGGGGEARERDRGRETEGEMAKMTKLFTNVPYLLEPFTSVAQ